MKNTLVMIMAGGKGSRLGPLTCHRAKPAVPFAGRYRIIDFVLSNFVNSGYRRIYVLTQYMASSLIKHLSRNWRLGGISEFIEVVPAQMRRGDHWYLGTADSVFQNLNLIYDSRADVVAVFGGDHIYKFDVSEMDTAHRVSNADLTIAAFPVPRAEASSFGVIQVDNEGRVTGFQEKPSDPTPMPNDPTQCLVSMGNYMFRRDALVPALIEDASNPDSAHDFGKNVIPKLLEDGADIRAYDFGLNSVAGRTEKPYWRDVGTLDSYFAANMEVRSPFPTLNLYDRGWRIRTAQRDYPPARFVEHFGDGLVDIRDSLVAEGSIIASATLHQSVIGYDCFVHTRASVLQSVVLNGCDIGAGAHVRCALLDKNVRVAPGARIGMDVEGDKRRFPFITPAGVVVLPKGCNVPPTGPVEYPADVYELLVTDPATRDNMARCADFAVPSTTRSRHSYRSVGPGVE
jgi:glucose-1-phosphate adenylyltransferase